MDRTKRSGLQTGKGVPAAAGATCTALTALCMRFCLTERSGATQCRHRIDNPCSLHDALAAAVLAPVAMRWRPNRAGKYSAAQSHHLNDKYMQDFENAWEQLQAMNVGGAGSIHEQQRNLYAALEAPSDSYSYGAQQ